jgi:hypothetical protein
MILLDLILFNDYNSEKQREIIADVMHAVNDTLMFWCKLTGGTNTRFLVGMNTIATKMFLLMYDPVINPKLDECRGTVPQPISVNKEFLSLVSEYNTLLMEYNQYLNIQRYNTEYLSVVNPSDPAANSAPATNVSSASVARNTAPPQTSRARERTETAEIVEEDDGYISSDDDSFAGFNIDSVM